MAQTKTPAEHVELAPDQRKLTALQARRLSALTDVHAREIEGHTIVELSEKLKWRIDPALFFFRRICGKVVKKDPVTGIEYPVPFATVYVEDTDCSLVGYFPHHWPWGWYHPIRCHREVIATTRTDRCGHFCVYVPRFDIDWILRWRRERICFWEIFTRPSLADLLDLSQQPKPVFPPRGGPGPDPGPESILTSLSIATAEALLGPGGRERAVTLRDAASSQAFGARARVSTSLADVRAFDRELPPPMPEEFQQALTGSANVVAQKGVKPHDAVRSAVASHLNVAVQEIDTFDITRFIGPFRRCIDIIIPQWQLILDVPDITFRVGQDVNGDGVEETIYSEGYFDVRWNAGNIPDVTLVASSIARESHTCDTPVVPCTNVPQLLFAGLMPLTLPAYFDSTNGYALRPNRPIPPVGPRPVAQTPFLQTLQLFGCTNVPNAHFYRVMTNSDNGATYSAITGLDWNIYPIPSGPPQHVFADAIGWYPVNTNPGGFHLGDMVLEWPTPALGKFLLKIEMGDAAKHPLPLPSNVVAIQVDNTAPTALFTTLAWKFSSEPDSALSLPGRNLLVPCPTIRRGDRQDIEIQFTAFVSAHHLRDAYLYSHGCGGGSFTLVSPAANTTHWHQTVSDNSVVLSGRYKLDGSSDEGAYGLGCRANSRAMNPSGGDGGHLLDRFYDVVYQYAQPEVEVAIVNG